MERTREGLHARYQIVPRMVGMAPASMGRRRCPQGRSSRTGRAAEPRLVRSRGPREWWTRTCFSAVEALGPFHQHGTLSAARSTRPAMSPQPARRTIHAAALRDHGGHHTVRTRQPSAPSGETRPRAASGDRHRRRLSASHHQRRWWRRTITSLDGALCADPGRPDALNVHPVTARVIQDPPGWAAAGEPTSRKYLAHLAGRHSKMHEPIATVDGVADRAHGRFRRELAVVQDVRPAAKRLADLAKHGGRLRRLPLIGGHAGCCC